MALGLGATLSTTRNVSTPGIVTSGLVLKQNYDTGAVVPISDGAAFFDGTDDYITTGTWFVPATTDFTLSCWAYSADWSGDDDVMIWYGDATSGGGLWTALTLASSRIEFSVDDNSTKRVAQSGTLSGSGWKHIVGVRDVGTTIKLYIDGSEIASTTDDGNTITNTAVVTTYIGVGSNNGSRFDYFSGNICNAGVWTSVLTAAQIKSIMYKDYSGLTTSEKTNLVSWWDLDVLHVDGSTVVDSHGSNNGTLT